MAYLIRPVVAKFGGTSVATAERIKTIGAIVKAEKRPMVVVVSAVSGVTDLLISSVRGNSRNTKKNLAEIKELHANLSEELFENKKNTALSNFYVDFCLKQVKNLLGKKTRTKAFQDEVLSYGEIMSSFIVSVALNAQGVSSKQVIARDLIVTDENFGSSEFLPRETEAKTKKKLLPLLEKNIVPVVTGFIGATKKKQPTTLGRGGSDYSASIIGYAMDALEIQIWTDVDGVYSADPRIVKNPKHLGKISYREASEMAWFGAKVLHPRTMRPAITKNIPIRVLNTFNPTAGGTIISVKGKNTSKITAISSKKNITLVNIYSTEMLYRKGYLAKIFEIFSKNDISIDLVSASEVSVSVTLDNDENLTAAVKGLSTFTMVSVTKDLGIVAIVGEGVVRGSDTVEQIFSILKKNDIAVKMVSLGATDINMSLVVESEKVERAVLKLHEKLL